jgi:hypothetical protein
MLQLPLPHVSAPLQKTPSSHDALFGVFTQLPLLHVSVVHGLPSSHCVLKAQLAVQVAVPVVMQVLLEQTSLPGDGDL